MDNKNAIYNNPAFLAFRAGHKGNSAVNPDSDSEAEPVKEVTVKEEGKSNSTQVKNEEDK
jgi:hypothetical protein